MIRADAPSFVIDRPWRQRPVLLQSQAAPGRSPAGGGSPPPVDGDADDELMLAVAAGRHDAFRRLAERHLPRVIRMAARHLGNASDAEEVGQEAMVRIWQTAPRWTVGRAKFSTWLYRIVINLCIDRSRKPGFAPIEDAGDPHDPAPQPDAQTESVQLKRLVAAELQRLPPRQRAALVLCYYEGLTGAEAAAVLSMPLSALESLLFRGRRQLRARLQHLARR